MRERIKFLSQDEKFLTPIYLDTNRNLHPVSDLVKLDYSYKSTFNRKLFFRDMLLPKNNFGLMRYIYRYNKKLYGTDERKKDSNLIASYTEMQNFELKFLINKYRLLHLSNRWADGSKFDFSVCEFPRKTG